MILLENGLNKVAITAGESITASTYYFNIVDCQTKVETPFYATDISLHPVRYNLFNIYVGTGSTISTGYTNTSSATTYIYGLKPGYFDYYIYQSSAHTTILETGKMLYKVDTAIVSLVDDTSIYEYIKIDD